MFISKATLLALLPFFVQINSQSSGSGKSTRYWDCCKPSCSWSKKVVLASGAHPANTCDRNDNYISNVDAKSGCDGGGAYMCTNQMPWAVTPDLAYGFAAVSISGGNEASWCCACYEITFTSGPVAGKKMIVQATNTGGDLGSNHFDIAMPGGGFGIFNGCTNQWASPSTQWGQQYGGVSSTSHCDTFPEKLKAGCKWRFDWFLNADNPSLNFKQITCPKALTDRTGCIRAGEVPTDNSLPATTKTKTVVSSFSTVKSMTIPTTVSTTSSIRPTTTSSSPAIPNATRSTTSAVTEGGPFAQQWGQCAGEGYSGPKTCAPPYTCVFNHQYYSQCL